VDVSVALFQREPVVEPMLLARIHAATAGPSASPDVVTGGVAVLLAETGLVSSRSEARRLIGGGGVTVNGTRVADPAAAVPEPIAGEWLEVRLGKRNRTVVRLVRS
jgi:tyrosyl-tRNA synthetase